MIYLHYTIIAVPIIMYLHIDTIGPPSHRPRQRFSNFFFYKYIHIRIIPTHIYICLFFGAFNYLSLSGSVCFIKRFVLVSIV